MSRRCWRLHSAVVAGSLVLRSFHSSHCDTFHFSVVGPALAPPAFGYLLGHYRLSEHEFEQTLDSEGQGSLACCSPWGCKELDTAEQLSNNKWAQMIPEPSNSGRKRGRRGRSLW